MRIDGLDRLNIRRTMLEQTDPFRRVYVLLATATDCTSCGYEKLSDSGLDPTCATCDGTGKVVTFEVHEVRARIKTFDFVQLQGAGAVPPGVELGDMALYVRQHDKATFDELYDERRSYVYVEGEGESYRPFSISADGVGKDDETRIVLKKVKLADRAAGY